jgi:stearoyl-CoA desaturase (delta-9 desaturase)
MISEFTKLRALILAVHCAGAWGLYTYWDPLWLVLSGVSVFAFLWLGQELYCHRFLSHKAFKLSQAWQRVFAFLSIFNLFGNPIGIASTHVNHHKYADTPQDPHPASTPWLSWFWLSPGFETSRSTATVKRLLKDRWLVLISRHYFKIYFVIVGCVAAVDLRIAVYGFFLPVMYAFFCDGLVNVVCHKYGYRLFNTDDCSRNNLIANAVLLGSGVSLHNTHHAKPNDYRLSRRWYEVDAVAAIIEVVQTKDRKEKI